MVEADIVLQRMAVNDYTKKVEGLYSGIYADVAKAVNGVQDRVKNIVRINKNIAKGNLEDLESLRKVGRRSEHDEVVPAFIATLETLSALIADTCMLAESASDGNLEVRVDAAKHNGEFRKIVQGINDAVHLPAYLIEVPEYLLILLHSCCCIVT